MFAFCLFVWVLVLVFVFLWNILNFSKQFQLPICIPSFNNNTNCCLEIKYCYFILIKRGGYSHYEWGQCSSGSYPPVSGTTMLPLSYQSNKHFPHPYVPAGQVVIRTVALSPCSGCTAAFQGRYTLLLQDIKSPHCKEEMR